MSDTELKTQEVDGLIRAGRAAIRVGDYEAARTTFEQAVAIDPANQAAIDGLREAQRRLGKEYTSAAGGEQATFCYRHPDVETALQCTACGRPICARCSTPAAVGQLCPECRKGRRPANYKVAPLDLIKGGLVALVVTTLAAGLLGLIRGFFIFFILFFIAPAAAEFVVRTVDRVTRSKRGRPMQIAVAIAMIVGGLIAFQFVPNLLAIALFLLIGVSTAVARLR
jgi:hypothetical protein